MTSSIEAAAAEAAIDLTSFASDGIFVNGVIDGLLRSESGWVLLLAGVVLGIGQSFETLKHTLEHRLPQPLLPVLEAVLAEMTTLGFSGLLIGAAEESGLLENTLSPLSQQWLGEPKLLFEIFEDIEHGLFPTVVAFALVATFILGVVTLMFELFLNSTQTEKLLAALADDDQRDACAVPEAADNACRRARGRTQKVGGILISSMSIPGVDGTSMASGTPLRALAEILRPASAWRAEFLRFRARFIEQERAVGSDFLFGRYLQLAATENLKALVSLEPIQLALVWAPLISLEVLLLEWFGTVQGDFLAPVVALSQVPILVWTSWNYVRLHRVKTMLMPQLGVLRLSKSGGLDGAARDDARADDGASADDDSIYRLLPPRYSFLGQSFLKPTWFDELAVLERPFASPALTVHDGLWGRLGAAGPGFYKASLRLCLFSAVGSLAFLGAGGYKETDGGFFAAEAATALSPLLAGGNAALSESLVAPLTLLGSSLTWLPSVLAVGLTPLSLICYTYATSVEGYRRPELVRTVLRDQRTERFKVTLATLASLCEWVDRALPAAALASGAPSSIVVASTAASMGVGKQAAVREALDINGDGVADSLYMDTSGDGKLDVVVEVDAVGMAIDTTGDGTADSVGVDTVGDGKVDTVVRRRLMDEVEAAWGERFATERPERLLDVRAVFESHDSDGSGSIGTEELGDIMRELGYAPSESDVRAAVATMAAVNDDGLEIGYKEFATAVLSDGGAGAAQPLAELSAEAEGEQAARLKSVRRSLAA